MPFAVALGRQLLRHCETSLQQMNCLSQKLSSKSGDFKTLPDLHQVTLEDKKLKGGTGVSSGLLIASTSVFSRRRWGGGGVRT